MKHELPKTRAKWLFFALMALPAAELLAFIAVAVAAGFVPAFLSILAISAAGVLLLRMPGGPTVSRVQVALNERGIAGIELADRGFHRVLAAILLIIPGFITGLLGALLLVPAIRRLLAGIIHRSLVRATTDPSVVDLPPDEWRQVPQDRLPDRRDRDA